MSPKRRNSSKGRIEAPGLGRQTIRTLAATGLLIVTLASVAIAGGLTLGVSSAREAGPVIVQGEWTKTPSTGKCKLSGCNREICSDHDLFTPCIWRPEFSCYKRALCEAQPDGNCGWTMTAELKACLRSLNGSLSRKSHRRFASPPN